VHVYLVAEMSVSVVVTGASGLLGRALCQELKKNALSWLVQGLAWTRAAGNLLKVDITCRSSVHELFQSFKVSDQATRRSGWKCFISNV